MNLITDLADFIALVMQGNVTGFIVPTVVPAFAAIAAASLAVLLAVRWVRRIRSAV